MFVLVHVILSMVLVQEAHSAKCPPKDTVPLRSCSCFKFTNTLIVRCENVNNTGFVKILGKHLNGNISLTLSNLKVKRIPENFLGDMHVVDLGIHNSMVEDIDSNAFVKQKDYLSFIRITTTSLKIVFNPAFQGLVNLQTYWFTGVYQNKPSTSLKVISKSDTSTVPAGIQYIGINSYGIESIEADSFTRFQKLTHLYFQRNHLTSLKHNSLPDSLRFIDIRNNHFTEIPVQVLLTLKNVQSIDLMNNKISKLPEESSLKRLLQKNVTLYLDGKPTFYGFSNSFNIQRCNIYYPL
ncbi:Uncharacterised protein g11407 [Pycnogonum litorale]